MFAVQRRTTQHGAAQYETVAVCRIVASLDADRVGNVRR